MSSVPRVSIVIPTYNRAGLLRQALASVIAQTVTDWECIVVNNFSDDDTRDAVASLDDPRIRLVDFRNHGIIAASRNKGLSLARGAWVAFLDSDDTWRPEKLARCLAVADAGVDVVNHRFAKVRDGKVIWTSPHHQPADATYRNMLLKENCLAPLTVMVLRTLLDAVGGFAENPDLVTAEDRDLWLKLAGKGARVAFIDAVLADYRVHEAGASRAVAAHMAASLAVLERHYRALTPKRPLDALRYRRERALVVYGAGRTCQAAGDRAQALRHFTESAAIYPLVPRVYAAALLCLLPIGGGE